MSFLPISVKPFFWNGNDDYGYAMKAAENMLNEHYKTVFLVLR
jgi:hypothetical protein